MSRHSSLTGILLLWSMALFAQPAINSEQSNKQDPSSQNPFFTDFTCVAKKAGSVAMHWKADNINQGDYFIVERSRDGNQFETLSAQMISDTADSYYLIDDSPFNGTGFYRIKWLGKSGSYIYSKAQQVSFSSNLDFRFYPNPADKLLIIRTDHRIDVQIMDATGATRITGEFQPGLQIVNLSALQRGNYVLKVADKDSNTVISEQLVKN